MVTRWLSFPRCVGSLILLTLMPLTARAQFPIVANDVVLGLSRSDPLQTLNVARGPREAMGGSSEVPSGMWLRFKRWNSTIWVELATIQAATCWD